ncbi:MAG: hypothetical protein ABSC08_01490 [Bryobacteraceae bacterium]
MPTRLLRFVIACAWLAVCACLPALAETRPRESAEQYPVRASAAGLTLAAEYFGRSAPGGKAGFFTGHFIVVELAVFPAKGQSVEVHPSDFQLVINGAKLGLMPQSGSVVAAALKYYDASKPSLSVGAGPFIFGRPRVGSDIPENPGGTPPPHPEAPDQNPNSNVERAVPDDPAVALPALGLDDCVAREARSGYLYFFWQPHTKKIKSLELRWQPEPGAPPRAVLKLLPQP